jgi:hypothetical protein
MTRWKGAGKHDATPIRTEPVSGRTYRAHLHAQSLVFEAIDGTFPEYRSVIPAGKVSGVAAQFYAPYVYAMHRAGEALNDDPKRSPWVTIMHNGEGPALIHLDVSPDFVGIIMPFRVAKKAPSPTAPAWARKALPVPEPDVVAHCTPDLAPMLDPTGALQAAGLLVVDGAPCDA